MGRLVFGHLCVGLNPVCMQWVEGGRCNMSSGGWSGRVWGDKRGRGGLGQQGYNSMIEAVDIEEILGNIIII